jgi:hypothetical protein
MVERERPVIERAVLGERIGGIEERALHGAGDVEHAGEPNGAECFEAVGVLQDGGFEGARRDVGGEAVRVNGVMDGVELVAGEPCLAQQCDGVVCRVERCQRALG